MTETFVLERMSRELVGALFETVPLELTVIDRNDEVVAWNKHKTRLFSRPYTAMGLNFRNCHPQHTLDRVLKIVEEMKAGTRDKARFWIDLPVGQGGAKHKILIEFYALRDEAGSYLGCVECTQDVEDFRSLDGQKRLLD
jgi:uncharacterized protein